jgi:hypothetical protein
MKNYIKHLKETRTTHQRRQHALQIAGVVTAALFVVWIGTLGTRLASQDVAAQSPDTSLTAAAAASTQNKGAQLEVSTTSVYRY